MDTPTRSWAKSRANAGVQKKENQESSLFETVGREGRVGAVKKPGGGQI